MDYLKELIQYIGVRNLVIFASILIVLIIFMIIYHSVKLKVYRQEILELENQITGIKTLPLQYRLGRVQSIAKNMPEVVEQYEEFTKDFEEITEFQKNELGVLVDEVDAALFYGKSHGVKKKLTMIQEMIQRYDRDAKALLARIEKVTEIENIQRIEIIRVKEKYRQVGNEYDKIRITFWRTRWDGMTLYKASVTPCRVETKHGITCETCEPMKGYQYTLKEAKRASKKAEDSARVDMQWFIHRALDLLADDGFKTFLCGKDLAAVVIDIVKSIECEVR